MDFNLIKTILLIIVIHLIINIITYFFKYHIRIKYYTTNEDIYPDLNKEFAYDKRLYEITSSTYPKIEKL